MEQVGLGRELSYTGKASHALRNSGVGVAKYKWIKVQEIIRKDMDVDGPCGKNLADIWDNGMLLIWAVKSAAI